MTTIDDNEKDSLCDHLEHCISLGDEFSYQILYTNIENKEIESIHLESIVNRLQEKLNKLKNKYD